MKGKYKPVAFIYYVTSIFFYVAAILGFTAHSGMAVCYLGLGSSFLCLATAFMGKKDSDEQEKTFGLEKKQGITEKAI